MGAKTSWVQTGIGIGIGILVGGAALIAPNIGQLLVAIGLAIVVASILFHWFRLLWSFVPALLLGILAYFGLGIIIPLLVGPEDNLVASFKFTDPTQIDKGSFDVDYVLHNKGSKSELIESQGILQVINYYSSLDAAKNANMATICLDKDLEGFVYTSGLFDHGEYPLPPRIEYFTPSSSYINTTKVDGNDYKMDPGEKVEIRNHFDTRPVNEQAASDVVVTQCPVLEISLQNDTSSSPIICQGDSYLTYNLGLVGTGHMESDVDQAYQVLPLPKAGKHPCSLIK